MYIRLMHIQILVFTLLLNFPSKSGVGWISKEELALHLAENVGETKTKRSQDYQKIGGVHSLGFS